MKLTLSSIIHGYQFYGNPPAGAPCPPCLILDLEKTLIGSEHSAQYGWRHVKRPGLTQFIEKLSKYYEIVIFTENDIGVMSDLIAAIDPEGCVPHRFGSAQAEKRDGAIIKRLDFMNRDLSQVILIDDSTVASQMFPRNTLLVKPFNDVNDSTDTVLYDLVPLLQAFIHDQSTDFRDTLDDLGTHEAEEACIEYKMRVSEKKRQEAFKRNRGIGGLVRSKLLAPTDLDPTEFRSTVLTASQIVGASPDGVLDREGSPHSTGTVMEHKGFGGKPIITGDVGPKAPVTKKKGAIFTYFEEAEKEREEIQARKKEKLEQIYIKKMTEKANSKAKNENDVY
jgi:NLI interacting factor-like phosphatase